MSINVILIVIKLKILSIINSAILLIFSTINTIMSVLSDILRDIHAKASVYFCDQLVPPWNMKMRDLDYSSFHQVRRGQCIIECAGETQLAGPGDIIFIPKGSDHDLKSVDGFTPGREQEFKTMLLCGYFQFDQPIDHPLMASLPPLIIIRSETLENNTGLKYTMDFLSEEFTNDRPGSKLLMDKLTEIMLIQLIRTEFTLTSETNFSKALFDNQISKALKLIHGDTAHSWTLENLATLRLVCRAPHWQIVLKRWLEPPCSII